MSCQILYAVDALILLETRRFYQAIDLDLASSKAL